MSRYRDFDAARAEHDRETITFKLGGEEFTVPCEIPAGVMMSLGRAVARDDDMAAFAAFVDLWDAMIPEPDQDRFAKVVNVVDMGTVLELVGWLFEESTGRPLGSVLASGPQPSTSGPTSNGPSGSPAAGARST